MPAQHFAGQHRTGATAVVALLVTALLALGIVRAPVASAAVASKIAPAAAAMGTGITIAGELLSDTTGVTFLGSADPGDDVAASSFIAMDAKKLVVQVPAGAQTGPIEVTGPDGPVVTPIPFTVYQPPSITSLSAPSGKPDDVLTITGSNLMGAKTAAVAFGPKKATLFKTSTQTELQLKVPAGLPGGPVPMTLTNTGGTVRGTFYIAPAVKAIAPATGTTAGGTTASITGAGFTGVGNFVDDPATTEVDESLDGVTIGGNRVLRLIAVSDKELVVKVPPGTDPAAPVVVKTTQDGIEGVSGNLAKFAYRPLPTVTGVSKNWNAINSPSEVVFTGVNLTETTVVSFGALVASGAVVDPVAGTLTVTPPASTKAAVTAATFTNTANGLSHKVSVPFGYTTTPVLGKVAPLTGPEGTTVTLSGTGFGSGTRVYFGATEATDCKIVTFLVMSCKAPAGADVVDVTVDNGVGVSPVTLATKFTYTVGTPTTPPVVGRPVVAPLIPAFGATGSTVDIRGANVHTVTKVEFTGEDGTWVEAPDFMVPLAGRLVVRVPADALTGEIRVTSPAGVVETVGRVFTKTVRPSIDSIDAVGDTSFGVTPGDLLTIKGEGLIIPRVKSFVTIGGKPAPILTKPIPNPRTIVVRVPPSVGGREVVEIVTPLGKDVAEISAYQIPEIKSIKPISYSRLGGTVVTIGGVNFTGVDNLTVGGAGRLGAVTFGGVPVAKLVFVNDKTLVAVTAPGSASADELVVTTQHDGRYGNSAGKTRSVDAPLAQIDTVSPDNGPTGAAPPPVTITGMHLKADSIVKFGAAQAIVQSAAPDGTSMVVLPPIRVSTVTVGITVTNFDDGDELTTTKAGAYSYLLQPATVTGLSATTGVPGSALTISGTSFVDVTSVTIGGVPVTYTVANSTTIFTTVPATPPGAAGTAAEIVVVNATGEPSTADPATANDWTWDNSPTVVSLSASTGAAGSTVTITGSNFVGVTNVRFGYTNATYTVVDSSTITATVPATPAGAGGTAVDVVVEIGASVSLVATPTADNWTWMAPAVVTSMSHNTAPAGTVVTVNGTGFTNITSFTVHTKVVSYTVVSPTQITFVAPAGDASGPMSVGSKRDLRITNGSGAVSTANPATADDWTFQ